jgi:hypothetical protein
MEKDSQALTVESVAPPPEKNKAALVEMGNNGVMLRSLDDLLRFARMAVAGGAAPKSMSEGAAAVSIQAGLEVGLGPLGGLRNGLVINGVFSWRGKAAAALIQNSAVCKPGTLKYWCEGEGENRKGVAEAWRVGYASKDRREFTINDAKQARLWGKAGPWTEYSSRMLKWRALGLLADDVFSDVLGGFPLAEEAVDFEPIVEKRPPITTKPELPASVGPDPLLEALDINPAKEEAPEIVETEVAAATDAEPKETGPSCKHGSLDSDFCQECSAEADAAIAARDK